jgi:hypothetical protein
LAAAAMVAAVISFSGVPISRSRMGCGARPWALRRSMVVVRSRRAAVKRPCSTVFMCGSWKADQKVLPHMLGNEGENTPRWLS